MTRERREACYALLGLEVGASLAEVKAAYREEVQLLHPDRLEKQPHMKKRSTDKLAKVNAAYAALREVLAAEEEATRSTRARERDLAPS